MINYTNSATLTITMIPSLEPDIKGIGIWLESIKGHERLVGFRVGELCGRFDGD